MGIPIFQFLTKCFCFVQIGCNLAELLRKEETRVILHHLPTVRIFSQSVLYLCAFPVIKLQSWNLRFTYPPTRSPFIRKRTNKYNYYWYTTSTASVKPRTMLVIPHLFFRVRSQNSYRRPWVENLLITASRLKTTFKKWNGRKKKEKECEYVSFYCVCF